MDQNYNKVKVVYYTHPLCLQSWAMQQAWDQLIKNLGGFLDYRFCIPYGPASESSKSPQPARDLPAFAVKVAALQSPQAAHLYMSALRNACFVEKRNEIDMQALVEIARTVSKENRHLFDLQQFGRDFSGSKGKTELLGDQKKIRLNRISVFPTITFTLGGKGAKVSGPCTFEKLLEGLKKISALEPIPNSSINILPQHNSEPYLKR